jgi:hypothetical protein
VKHKFMAAIRKASMEYRTQRGKNPKTIYVSDELAKMLLGKNWSLVGPGPTGFHYDNNHCTLDIHITSPSLGPYFNCIGDEDDYQSAVAEYWLLNSTDSKSPMEEKDEKSHSGFSNNVVNIHSKRSRSI